MSVTVKQSDSGKTVTIQVAGRFDFSCHQAFIKAYKETPKGEYNFIVDLSKTDYMDSSAMGMLLKLREHSTKQPQSVVLANGNEAIQEILRIANFGKIFTLK